MATKKRFQKQELNSNDYEKTETGAKLVKNGNENNGHSVIGFYYNKKIWT